MIRNFLLALGLSFVFTLQASHGESFIDAGNADAAAAWDAVDQVFSVRGVNDTNVNVGRQGAGLRFHQALVIPFQLPDFGAVAAPFQNAELIFRLNSNESVSGINADLYGLPSRASSTVLPSGTSPTNRGDFFMGGFSGGSANDSAAGVVKIQDNILTPNSSVGPQTTNFFASAQLASYLNAAYGNGVGAGRWVFVRFSVDAVPSGANRYGISTANHATVENRPRIRYNFDPAPDPVVRPSIWVRNSEKAAILDKIANHPWAASLRNSLQSRMAANLASHQSDRDAFIRQLPVEWDRSPARYKAIPAFPEWTTGGVQGVRGPTESRFNAALDCAVLYYLTGNEAYAALAGDLLHNVVRTLLPVAASTSVGNGGWIFQNDFLKEARVSGTQLPVVYDFLYGYLKVNPVYDVQSGNLVPFEHGEAQVMFRKFYQLCRDHGQTNNNWSALMATCMLNNLLALNDEAERDTALNVYITTGGPRQDPLAKDYQNYSQAGDIWPESLQYANAVANIRATHMVLIERFDPSRNLFNSYPNLPLSLGRVSELVYPNGQLIRFGDGQRSGGSPPYFRYELIYQHALARGRSNLTSYFGPLIKKGMETGAHNRASLPDYSALGQHDELLKLLWFAPEIVEQAAEPVLPRTDRLPFAGITLQRNPSPLDGSHGLMSFVGGGGFVHSHASGMSMELYGLGHVLGAKGGRSTYQTPIHNNYYRLFAANNTVIVNGGSRGEGGWQGISINNVQNVAMEPQASASAVSPKHSFSVSSFVDDKGSLAQGTQQRTLALVRSSPTSGFYVDVFRTRSTVTNRTATTLNGPVTNQYHDYIYRNVGNLNPEVLVNGTPASFTSQANRFQNDIGDSYKQPGWRYFENTRVTQPVNQPVRAQFVANVGGQQRCMTLHMPAVSSREIAMVESPPIVDAPSPYTNAKSPTLVIRQIGDTWDRPFVSVFEPHFGNNGGTIQNVTPLSRDGNVVGVKVDSVIGGKNASHYIISNPADNQPYTNSSAGISFSGRFGIIADMGGGEISLYLGRGSALSYRGRSISTNNGSSSQAEVRFSPGLAADVTANTAVTIVEPPAPVISMIEDQGMTPATSPLEIPFTVSDSTVPASNLTVTASSPDAELFPQGSLMITGAGEEKVLTITPAPGVFGSATIQIAASNGESIGTRSVSVLVASGTPVIGVLSSLASDAAISDALAVIDVTSNSGMLGTSGNDPWVDRCMVFVFQLPDFGPVDAPFVAANFSFNYHGKTNTPGSNDLYGLPTRVSSNVVTGQYYGQTPTPDPAPGTYLLQAGILDGSTPFGILHTSITGSEALVDYLNTAYASGAGAGRYAFLRLNTTIPKNGVRRANIHFSEGGNEGPPDTRPHISFSAIIPESAPTVSTPENLSAAVGQAISEVTVTVGDAGVSADDLILTATSSNQALLPAGQILISGNGGQRGLGISPIPHRLGTTIITLTVDNGTKISQTSFLLEITGDARQRWRFHHFGTTADSGESAMTANPDGDAYGNEAEYVFGTDPTVAYPQPLLALTPDEEEPTLEFTALKAEGPGYEGLTRRYTAEFSEDLQTWNPLPEADRLLGLNQSVLIELPGLQGSGFYRLRVELEP